MLINNFNIQMTFSSVQDLATQRRKVLDKALRVLAENYPTPSAGKECAVMTEFKQIVNDFFLTDHVYEEDNEPKNRVKAESIVKGPFNPVEADFTKSIPAKNNSKQQEGGTKVLKSKQKNHVMATSTGSTHSPEVQPKSIKKRAPAKSRRILKKELMNSKQLTFSDYDSENLQKKENSVLDSPKSVFGILFGLTMFFLWLPDVSISIQLDIGVLLIFISAFLGMSFSPRNAGGDVNTASENRKRIDSETLIRQSLEGSTKRSTSSVSISKSTSILSSIVSTSTTNVFDEAKGKSPLRKFPDGAEIGSILNCWSEPVASEFKVRGANYLKDKVKVPSGPFLFPARGADLFISDCCPEHIAKYKALLGGKLREKPTMIINYRLPWGNFITYSEIPERFLPYLRYCYDKSVKPPPMTGMSNAEICASRYLMADDKGKDEILKIVPKVVKGPWVVKKTCDGKPAIVCNKMPTQYFYEPASEGKAEYLEVDLDIVASSAARAILAVAQRYTKTLTLDLGFVLQGNSPDELPEQMVFGARLHGLDPLTAPTLPQNMDSLI